MEEKTSSSAPGRNRRSLRNILVAPGGQVRLAFGMPIGGMLAVAFLLWALKNTLLSRLSEMQATAPNLQGSFEELQQVVSLICNLGVGFLLVGIVMVAAFGLLISHRYYGPQVPILRSLQALKAGKYDESIQLRGMDELKEIAQAVNELAHELDLRHKKQSS